MQLQYLAYQSEAELLSYAVENYGDVPFVAIEEGREVGFFCYNTNQTTKEGMLKFVIVNPQYQGKGIAKKMHFPIRTNLGEEAT